MGTGCRLRLCQIFVLPPLGAQSWTRLWPSQSLSLFGERWPYVILCGLQWFWLTKHSCKNRVPCGPGLYSPSLLLLLSLKHFPHNHDFLSLLGSRNPRPCLSCTLGLVLVLLFPQGSLRPLS